MDAREPSPVCSPSSGLAYPTSPKSAPPESLVGPRLQHQSEVSPSQASGQVLWLRGGMGLMGGMGHVQTLQPQNRETSH